MLTHVDERWDMGGFWTAGATRFFRPKILTFGARASLESLENEVVRRRTSSKIRFFLVLGRAALEQKSLVVRRQLGWCVGVLHGRQRGTICKTLWRSGFMGFCLQGVWRVVGERARK
jgi:hypothetical protein